MNKAVELVNIFLEDLITHKKAPSVSYLFFDKDKLIHEFQSGMADIAANIPVSAHTAYHAFSITKTFTALAILQLEEEGILDIDKPVQAYLPHFTYSAEISIRQLLSHSSGIPNPMPLSWIHLAQKEDTFDRDTFFASVFKKHNKLKSHSNQKYAYSNLGYVVLGMLIEAVSGLNYKQYITQNILYKIDPSGTGIAFSIPNLEHHAKGYHKKYSFSNFLLGFLIEKNKYMGKIEKGWKPFHDFHINGNAYGGLIGTPRTFACYIQELLKDESKLISCEQKEKLFTPHSLANGKTGQMCLSWFKGQLDEVDYYTHAGGGGGYYSEIRIYPALGLGSVVMLNRTGFTDERFLDSIDRHFLNTIRHKSIKQ